MAALEGYTGPTSGRITVGGDGPARVERFCDEPLSADETRAVAWFTALSPNEQLREVRRMKWNLAEAERGQEAALRRAREAEAENDRLAARLAARRPDGYELPRAAAELLELAGDHGWKTARAWQLSEDGQTALLGVLIGRSGWIFDLSWSVPVNGNGRGAMVRTGIARRPGTGWRDAPPLRRIKEILREAGEGEA